MLIGKVQLKRFFRQFQTSFWIQFNSLFYDSVIDAHSCPFFIVSSGRSGSTFLRKLMIENYDVNIPPESVIFNSQFFLEKLLANQIYPGLSK